MSQCDQILTRLKAGRPITSMQAFRLYRITRLAARIAELRERGHRISAPIMRLPSGKRIAIYSLAA